MENFGPYLGTHEVDLAVSDHAPVVLIHGENLHGKTSLFNAIRWCLYEEALDRRNNAIPLRELVNYDASDAGSWVAHVRLEFVHDGASYELERQMQADRAPVEDTDFEIVRSLRVGGQFVAEQQIEDRIRSVLHPSISNFFFFDGEMLNRYEDLLADDQRSAAVIKRSIEQILGLPSLQSVVADLQDLQRAASRKQSRALDATQRNLSLAQEAESIRDEVESTSEDLTRLNEQLEIEQAEKERLRQARQRYSDIEAEARELVGLEGEIEGLEAAQREQRDRCRIEVSSSWWAPLSATAAARLATAEAELEQATRTLSDSQGTHAQLDRLRKSLDEGACPTCEQPLDEEHRTRMRAEADRLGGLVGQEPPAVEELARLAATVRQLQSVADSGPAQVIIAAEREYRRLGIEIRRKRRRAEDIRDVLRDHEASEISSLEHEYDEVVERIRSISDTITEQERKMEDASSRLRRVEGQIRRLPGADPKIAAEAAALEALRDVFSSAIDDFRDRLRVQVEQVATEIFVQLISAQDLTELRINDQYGLRIVNDAGRELTTRSAGAEQVVALSLIGALNRCAVREGPVIMDTPFGRLDKTHRRRILEFVPRFGTQVMLLVQSGEFDRVSDLGYLGSSVSQEYEIVRVAGRSTQSEVREIA